MNYKQKEYRAYIREQRRELLQEITAAGLFTIALAIWILFFSLLAV